MTDYQQGFEEMYRLLKAVVSKAGQMTLSKQDCADAAKGRLEILPTKDDAGQDVLIVRIWHPIGDAK